MALPDPDYLSVQLFRWGTALCVLIYVVKEVLTKLR
jgi:hypothetical protein